MIRQPKTEKGRALKPRPKSRAGTGRCSGARGSALSADDALQIINNVAEEYLDHGETNFATKQELCEALLWLRREEEIERQRQDACINEVFARCARTLTRSEPNNPAQTPEGQRPGGCL